MVIRLCQETGLVSYCTIRKANLQYISENKTAFNSRYWTSYTFFVDYDRFNR